MKSGAETDRMKENRSHILLVEDNEGDIVLTQEAFEVSSFNPIISIARNGKEALDFLFRRGQYEMVSVPDLVLLDINIPIFNGHEVLGEIKKDAALKCIPVIMLTTSCSQRDRSLAEENECAGYFLKPMDMGSFYNIVAKIEEFLPRQR